MPLCKSQQSRQRRKRTGADDIGVERWRLFYSARKYPGLRPDAARSRTKELCLPPVAFDEGNLKVRAQYGDNHAGEARA